MWCHSFHLLRHDLESPAGATAETELPPVALLKGDATVVIKRPGLFFLVFLSFAPFVRPILVSEQLVVVNVSRCTVYCFVLLVVVSRLLVSSRVSLFRQRFS